MLPLAVAASGVAGLYPTWRAAQVQPAWQLKESNKESPWNCAQYCPPCACNKFSALLIAAQMAVTFGISCQCADADRASYSHGAPKAHGRG